MKIHQHKFLILIIVASVLPATSVSILPNTVKGQDQHAFSAVLSGKNEVPPTNPNSAGLATFQLSDNTSQISYSVNISGIKKASHAQINIGSIGKSGDVVATLAKEKSASGVDDPQLILISGNLTKNDLQGPLKDNEITDLANLMKNGTTYVNIYTDKYPEGAIRGQINFAEVEDGRGPSGSSKWTGGASSGGASPETVAPAPGINPSGHDDD
jgi:hypothetical protein